MILSSVYKGDTLTNDDERVFYSAYYDNLQGLQTMNALGLLNVEAADSDGRTALSVAASQGNLDSVKFLISIGANPSIRDARNNDAIRDATREKKAQVLAYLKGIINN
jgi:glutaminase